MFAACSRLFTTYSITSLAQSRKSCTVNSGKRLPSRRTGEGVPVRFTQRSALWATVPICRARCPPASLPAYLSTSLSVPERVASIVQNLTLAEIEKAFSVERLNKDFFKHYKDLESEKWVRIGEWGDAEEAKRILVEAIAAAKADKA